MLNGLIQKIAEKITAAFYKPGINYRRNHKDPGSNLGPIFCTFMWLTCVFVLFVWFVGGVCFII